MKTVDGLSIEIDVLRKEIEAAPRDKKLIKRNTQKIRYISGVKRYLETNPRRAFIEEMKESIERRIKLFGLEYEKFTDEEKKKRPLKLYEKEMGITELRPKLKTLKYILH